MDQNNDIRIRTHRPTDAGRLYPRYDYESDIVTVGSMVPRAWTYGVDIDGNIIFDLDKDRVLANLDLHIGRKLWGRGISRAWPSNAPSYDIEFTEKTVVKKSFSFPLQVRTDDQREQVEIDMPSKGSHGTEIAISLSEGCIAFVHDNRLTAILIRL